jgi:hypothetical protein
MTLNSKRLMINVLRSGIVIGILLLTATWAEAQSNIYLEECRKMARTDFSSEKQISLASESAEEQQRLLKKMINPELSVYGLAAYMSDVPDPASALAYAFDFNPVPHERLNLGMFLSQNIYNGGKYRLKKEEIKLNTDLEKQKIEENLMSIDNLVDEIFLGTILVRKDLQILYVQHNILDFRLKDTKALFQQGKLLHKDFLQVEMAVIDVETRIQEMNAEDMKYRGMLSKLTGREIKPDDQLIIPDSTEIDKETVDPAFLQLDDQAGKIELARNLSRSAALPKVQLFGTAGYGKPGFNFFVNRPDWYSGIGVLVNVPISAWRDHSHQDKILLIDLDRMSEYRHTLQKKRLLLETKYSGEVLRYETIEKQQTLVINKKEQIRKQMEILLKVGEASVSDYLISLNEETVARLNKEASTIGKIKEIMKRNRILVNLSNYPEK